MAYDRDQATFNKLKALANEGGVTLEDKFNHHWINTPEYFAPGTIKPPLPEWTGKGVYLMNPAIARGTIRIPFYRFRPPDHWKYLRDVAQIQPTAPHRLVLSWPQLQASGFIRVANSGSTQGWRISCVETPQRTEMTTTVRNGKHFVKFLHVQ